MTERDLRELLYEETEAERNKLYKQILRLKDLNNQFNLTIE